MRDHSAALTYSGLAALPVWVLLSQNVNLLRRSCLRTLQNIDCVLHKYVHEDCMKCDICQAQTFQ